MRPSTIRSLFNVSVGETLLATTGVIVSLMIAVDAIGVGQMGKIG